jgi:protein ImuB
MLWACFHFPDLPLMVFSRAELACRPAVVSSQSLRPDVVVANEAARQAGVCAGSSIAAALALEPDLTIHVRDEKAEFSALRSMASWAGQFTSTLAIEMPNFLLLEISECLKYFRGLKPLLHKIMEGLIELGFKAEAATAPTPTAARLLACAQSGAVVRAVGELPAALAPLPLSLLPEAQSAAGTLAGMGISTVGDLLALPRDGVARRFGQKLIDAIDRALGVLPDPRPLFVAPDQYHGQLELPAPVEDTEALLFAARRLVVELAGFLLGRGAGITRFRFDLVHEDEAPTSLVIGLLATRQSDHILNVLRERLSRLQLPDRVEAIRLTSEEIAPLQSRERDFFPASTRDGDASAQVFERLRARLGDDAVQVLALNADHRPELAWRYAGQPASQAVVAAAGLPAAAGARPLWLLETPEALPEGPSANALKLLEGPERIETGWWDGARCSRDYFVGRNDQGEQLWLFRDRSGSWFVHGLFA